MPKFIAQRIAYRGATPRIADQFTITEVKDGRVIGFSKENSYGDPLREQRSFNVKLQSGNRFYFGSGSGKIAYYLKEVQ